MVSSWGALAMENPRTLPSASVSGGFSRVMSTNWPALNVQSRGRSNRKAIVASAISLRSTSLALKTGHLACAVLISYLLPCSAIVLRDSSHRLRHLREFCLQIFLQCQSIVASRVVGVVEQFHGAVASFFQQNFPRLRMGVQLSEIALAEFLPLPAVVRKPRTQLFAWGYIP